MQAARQMQKPGHLPPSIPKQYTFVAVPRMERMLWRCKALINPSSNAAVSADKIMSARSTLQTYATCPDGFEACRISLGQPFFRGSASPVWAHVLLMCYNPWILLSIFLHVISIRAACNCQGAFSSPALCRYQLILFFNSWRVRSIVPCPIAINYVNNGSVLCIIREKTVPGVGGGGGSGPNFQVELPELEFSSNGTVPILIIYKFTSDCIHKLCVTTQIKWLIKINVAEFSNRQEAIFKEAELRMF
jgi:hypothetical protein